jgi:hypothetical protein
VTYINDFMNAVRDNQELRSAFPGLKLNEALGDLLQADPEDLPSFDLDKVEWARAYLTSRDEKLRDEERPDTLD